MAKELIPNPLQSDSHYGRYHCFDIPNLEVDDILDEIYALRPLLWGSSKDDWLRLRVKALEGELASRKFRKT